MGRKPNQLILEFFDRGAKIEDASNRYQYTCKACGEHFPKGRTDTLKFHITTKCQAVMMEDCRRDLSHIHNLPEHVRGRPPTPISDPVIKHGQDGPETNLQDGELVRLSIGGERTFTGLEALAEASRQLESPGPNAQLMIEDDGLIDPNLKNLDTYLKNFTDQFRGQDEYAISISLENEQLPAFSPSKEPSTFSNSNGASVQPTSTESKPSTLSMFAASASNLEANLPQVRLSRSHDANVPDNADQMPSAIVSPTTGASKRPSPDKDVQDESSVKMAKAAMDPRAVLRRTEPENPSSSASISHSKVRGKFTDLRRKEVQEVRKKGACIRCKMLRKTCSGGDPCGSCKNVETARLWKSPCLRTRLEYEFNLYAAGLYTRLAVRDVNYAKTHFRLENNSIRISISQSWNHSVPISVDAIQCHPKLPHPNCRTDPNLQVIPDGEKIILLDTTDTAMKGIVESYAQAITPIFHLQEQSGALKSTLTLASQFSTETQDSLLSRTLQLWTLTQILISRSSTWELHPPSSFTPQYPLALLSTQILATTETLASRLTKSLLNDLERRLLQRPQHQSFATFLTALILLNCVERMCWLFRSWEDDQDEKGRQGEWPLDKPPESYVAQGETFSDLLCTLLRVRGVPPKLHADGFTGFLVATEPTDPITSQWFESVKLTSTFLEDRRAAARWDANNFRSRDWRFAAKLLLP